MTPDADLTIARLAPRVTPFVGGMEVHVEQLSLAVRDRGHRQILVCSEGAVRADGIWMTEAPATRRFGTMIHDLGFGRVAQRALRYERFDIVHSHGDAFVARAGAGAAARRNVPHVHTMHGGVVPHRVQRAVLASAAPRGSTYLAVSREVAAELGSYGVPAKEIFVRPSGVRRPFLDVVGNGGREGVVVGGRLVHSKGILELARAWAAAGPGTRLTVLGDGPQRASLEELSKTTSQVEYVGPLGAAPLALLFASASIGIVPGTASSGRIGGEGTPTVGLEMLAAGCLPIVCGRVGELGPIVTKLDKRLVRDSVPSPEQVLRLEAALGETEVKRAEARRVIRAGYGWDRIADAVIDLYHDRIARFGA